MSENMSSRGFKALRWTVALLFIGLFIPFWEPLSLAIIFAFGIQPIMIRLGRKIRFCRDKCVAVMVIVVALILVLPLSLTVYGVANRISDFAYEDSVTQAGSIIPKVKNYIIEKVDQNSLLKDFDVEKKLSGAFDGAFKTAQGFVLSGASKVVTKVPDFMLSIFIFFLGLYFFLSHGSRISDFFDDQKFFSHPELHTVVRILQKSSYQTLFSLLVVGAIQAAVVTVGAKIFGFGDVLLIFLLTLIVSFIPVIGAAPVAGVLSIYLFATGKTGPGIGMLVVGGIAGSIDNILKPYLVSGDDVPAILSLISLIGALILFGFPGLFIGPVLATLAAELFEVRKKNLEKQQAESTILMP